MQTDKEYQIGYPYLCGWLQATIGHIAEITNDGTIPPSRRLQKIRDQVEQVNQDVRDWEDARRDRLGIGQALHTSPDDIAVLRYVSEQEG